MLIDWFTVLAQAINFLILVWLMRRYLYQPILDTIAARETHIATELRDAQKKQAEATRKQGEIEQKQSEFDAQRGGLLHAAQQAAQTEGKKLLDAARTEADTLRTKLEAAVQGEREQLSDALLAHTRKEVFAIAGQVLSDLAAESVEAAMCMVFVQRLHALDGPARMAMIAALSNTAQPARIASAFELPAAQREAIAQAVQQLLGHELALQYDSGPSLICGIELSANGHKVAWSINDYLTALGKQVDALLVAPAKADVKPATKHTAPAKPAAAPPHKPVTATPHKVVSAKPHAATGKAK